MFTLTALQQLIDSEPANTGRTAEEVAAWCNEAIDVVGVIPSRRLLRWGAQASRLAKLRDAVVNHASLEIRSIADAAVLTVSREDTELDMADAGHVALVDALVAAAVLEAGDKTALIAEATQASTRALEALGEPVKAGWVEEARRGQ